MPLTEIIKPIFIAILLMVALRYYWKYPKFRTPLLGTLCLVAWGGFYAPMMYLAAGLDRPFCDSTLAGWDAALSIHIPSIVEWTREHPAFDSLLRIAYASVGIQTAMVLVFSSMPGVFIKRFIIGSTVCLVAMCFMPAVGPFYHYAYEMVGRQEIYLQHLHACRENGLVLCTSGEGLITFPSFHTIWALFLMAAARGWVRAPAVCLNILVILATMTTGWHYGIDTLMGLAIGTIIIFNSEKVI